MSGVTVGFAGFVADFGDRFGAGFGDIFALGFGVAALEAGVFVALTSAGATGTDASAASPAEGSGGDAGSEGVEAGAADGMGVTLAESDTMA